MTRIHHDSRSQDFNQGYLSAERFDGFAAWQTINLSDVKVSDVTPCTTLQMSVATVAIIPKWWKLNPGYQFGADQMGSPYNPL